MYSYCLIGIACLLRISSSLGELVTHQKHSRRTSPAAHIHTHTRAYIVALQRTGNHSWMMVNQEGEHDPLCSRLLSLQ